MANFKSPAVILSFILLFTFKISARAQLTPNLIFATPNTINTAVPFLTIPPDTRANALGGCGAATSPDINSQHWNAAKYSFMQETGGISLNYLSWLRAVLPDSYLAYIAGFYKPSKNQAISASVRFFSLSEIYFGTTPSSSYRPYDMSMDVGYSRNITRSLFAGIVLRYIHSDITGNHIGNVPESKIGRSFALDLSAYYNRELKSIPLPSYYAFGINISNLGTPISYTADAEKIPIPANLRIGNSIEISPVENHAFALSLDLNKLMVATRPDMKNDTIIRGMAEADNYFVGLIQSFYDAPGIVFDDGSISTVFREELNEIILNTGLEYTYAGRYFLRGGYFHESDIKGNRKYLSFGGGKKFRLLQVDLAVYIIGKNSPFRNTFSFSLSYLI